MSIDNVTLRQKAWKTRSEQYGRLLNYERNRSTLRHSRANVSYLSSFALALSTSTIVCALLSDMKQSGFEVTCIVIRPNCAWKNDVFDLLSKTRVLQIVPY